MIRLEGGYADNPKDPGGATKYGITQRTLDAVRMSGLTTVTLPVDVRALTTDQAAAIYLTTDWAQIHGDELPHALAPLMLNAAVNFGEPRAVMVLQSCLPGVPQTGFLGEQTLTAIQFWRSPYLAEQSLAEEFAARAAVRYASLYASEGEFELGWLRRLFRVYTLSLGS